MLSPTFGSVAQRIARTGNRRIKRDMPNTSEKVAKRLLDKCLSEWRKRAVKFQHENPDIAAEQIRSRIKWYMPLAGFNSRAYFDYFDGIYLARLWDSLTSCERGEWIVTQLRGCLDCPDSVHYAVTYFGIAQGSTYDKVVGELAKDLERSCTN
jgi:hypothetical protein